MIYFLASQIPALKSFSHRERLAIVADALNLLQPQQRIFMNILKLLLDHSIISTLSEIRRLEYASMVTTCRHCLPNISAARKALFRLFAS